MIGNHVNVKAFRGFESLLLRQRDAGPNLFRVQRYFLFIARQIMVASFLVPVYTPAVSNSHIAGFSFLQQRDVFAVIFFIEIISHLTHSFSSPKKSADFPGFHKILNKFFL